MIKKKELLEIRNIVREKSPLIHCITNPISINGCANIVLATGAKPIMAEHPREVEEITNTSCALAVNLGNITDIRMEAMMKSGILARDKNIPIIIDLVGVGCSKLRLNYAIEFIEKCKPNIIKGNMSEIKAILGVESFSVGIDVGKEDEIKKDNIDACIEYGKKLSNNTNSIVVITGIKDIITDGTQVYIVKNGHEMLANITGTGCMLNTLIASYMSTKEILKSAILGVLMMTIAGELSAKERGSATFMTKLLDNVYTMTEDDFIKYAKYEKTR
jgi:hydroxyethylthiazole kinase